MKKIFSFYCCVLLSIAAWGDTTATVDGIKYKIYTDKKTATVTYPNDSQPSNGTPSTYSGDITIPSSINYEGDDYSVTDIGKYAFRGASITSISLPEGLISIGYKAIHNTSISQLTIPNSVTTLEQESLSENSNLTNITFGAHIADNKWADWVCWSSSKAYDVYMICDTKPELPHNETFDDSHKSTIHVYPSAYTQYKADPNWNIYTIVADLQKDYTYNDLQDFITSYENILNNEIGTDPGYYVASSTTALSTEVAAAKGLTDGASTTEIFNAIRNMAEASGELETVPLTEGYYFIEDVYNGLYMRSNYAEKTDGGIKAKTLNTSDSRFYFKLTRKDGNWIVQCVDDYNNVWHLGGPKSYKNENGRCLTLTESPDYKQVITWVSGGKFKIQSLYDGSHASYPYCVSTTWSDYACIYNYAVGSADENRMYWHFHPTSTTDSFKGILTESEVKSKIDNATGTYLKLDKYGLIADDLTSNMPENSNLLVKVKTGSSITGTNIINNKTCENLVLTDGQPFGYTEDITATTASYSRSISNKFGTICLPYAVSSNENVQYYTLDRKEGSTLYLTKQDDIEAGVPAVFENLSDGTTLNITATDATIKGSVPAAADATLKLIGTFNEVVITDAEELAKDYYISGGKFRQANSSLTVKPFRAYFTTTSGNGVKMFNLSVLEEEETSIDNVQCSMLNAQSIYDANGMKQTSLRKGLNIMKMTGGSVQKVMVK